MTTMRLASIAALCVATVGCTVGESARPAYPAPSTDPSWVGPPGGAVDPGWGYTEGEGSYEGSYPPAEDDPAAYAQPSADPANANYALGDLTSPEMEAALQPYGEWVEDPVYGWIWIPYTTVVGADFTPYDSSGEWVYTNDYGWSFDSDFDWGWVAFHFGNWTMYDDASWGWVPSNTWAPHHCDWRHGGSTVGWRPTPPDPRDHRTGPFAGGWRPGSSGPANTVPGRGGRPHGGHKDPDTTWTFSAQAEFGLRNRPTKFAQSDGLRGTTEVVRPPFGTRDPSRAARGAAGLMGHRLQTSAWMSTHPTPVVRPQRGNWGGGGGIGQSTGGGRPWIKPPSPWGNRNAYQAPPTYGTPSYGNPSSRPTWNRPPDRMPQRPTWSDGNRGNGGAVKPSPYGSGSGGTAYQPRPTWTPPADRGPRYSPPSGSRPSGSYQSGPLWTRPVDRTPNRPSMSSGSSGSSGSFGSGNAWQPPPRPSYTPPADRAPSRGSWSSGSSGSSWNSGGSRAPSRPSFSPSSSGSSGSRPSFSPSSSGSSGGSRSYSPSSSSSSGSSRSSGSYSSGSSSSGSRSSGSSSSSSSSSGSSSRGSGGGSWRR